LVACLGLFGLVTFTAERRFKEIGIRKVLGSSVTQIVAMLSTDFLKLVGLSFLVAFPLGYYLMYKWLQGFAYRIEMQWWLFALAGSITMCISFATIGWKSYRAATMNPVKALRDE
ncbi:MAG TPA: FtsX-like permease family protein, partial [Pricia sp.]|nr:FtsX-like permease family protein [Pricia sp.]